MSRREFLKGVLAAGTSGVLSSVVSGSTFRAARAAEPAAAISAPARWTPTEPPNQPLGEAKGIRAGRVIWVHDPNVARWDGDPQSGGWFEDKFTDPALADQMLSKALRLVTDAKTDAEAWKALFRLSSWTHGRGKAAPQGQQVLGQFLHLRRGSDQRAFHRVGHGEFAVDVNAGLILRRLLHLPGARDIGGHNHLVAEVVQRD